MIEYAIPNLRRLRAFEATAQCGSVSGAARTIGLSQPAVTQAISALEQEVGSRLLERKATGSFLSQNGTNFLKRVERLLSEVDGAISEVGSARSRASVSSRGTLGRKVTSTQIRAILATAGAVSFSAAARDLSISEPSLHRSAREFESLVRRPLFRRTALGLSVNQKGAELARRLAVAFREFEYGLDEMKAAEGEFTGRISVGALGIARTILMPPLVSSFHEVFPNASVEIVDGKYEMLLTDLRHARLDMLVCALRNPPPAEDVCEETLFWDPFSIVVNADHPLTKLSEVSLKDLVAYEWIVPAHGTPVRIACDAIFERGGLRPDSTIEAHSYETVRALLMGANRVAISSHRQIAFEELMGLLAVIPYSLPRPGRVIGITTRCDWSPAKVQEKFFHTVLKYGRALDTERT